MPFKPFFKPSSPRFTPTIPSPDGAMSPWLARNQDTLDELARFVDFAEGFTLGFLEINFAKDLDPVLQALRSRQEGFWVEFCVFTLDDPNLRFLKEALDQEIQKLPPPPSLLLEQKRVIFVQGLEQSIGLLGNYPPLLQDLNFVRDAWIQSMPYPVIFCLPSYAINRIIRFAPDFWSWQSGVFRIAASQERQDEASIYALHAQKLLGNTNQLEKQARIHLLEQLAQEFDPLHGERSKSDLRIAVQALTQLGIVHIFSGEYLKAQAALDRARPIFDQPHWLPETRRDLAHRIDYLNWQGHLDDRLGNPHRAEQALQTALILNDNLDVSRKGITYFFLGCLKAHQGQVEEAITLHQQSLEIYERIGHASGKAASFHELARIKAQHGQVEEAITLHQQSLEIYERIGHASGKAASLHQLASLKADQGKVEEAIALHQESLEIKERIGDASGKAASLHQIAFIKAQQGQVEEAIVLHQESLEIKERIGDAYGKARSLHEIARIKVQQGRTEEACMLYQQSLEIKELIGDAYGRAITLSCIGQLLADHRGEFDTAISYLAESLAILKRLDSPKADTTKAILIRVQQAAAAAASQPSELKP